MCEKEKGSCLSVRWHGGGGKEAAVKPWAVTAVGSEPGGRALLASRRVRWSGTRGNGPRELVSASGWTVALGQR
jgi:hypothetical protein